MASKHKRRRGKVKIRLKRRAAPGSARWLISGAIAAGLLGVFWRLGWLGRGARG